ncbi:MAG TPA: PRC-barrel domain-containing protein [Patescibacteria group bacterium]|nr:PRC-barrel domain-containing protein [Patescibacteria group bacterium]
MKLKSIITASAFVLLLPFAAHASGTTAATSGEPATAQSEDSSPARDLKHGLKEAGSEIEEAAHNIRAFLINGKDPGDELQPVLLRRDKLAHGMIGAPVVNPDGEKVGTLKDIIINRDGDAILAVVSDGGLLGIGAKVAAFDYDKVMSQKPDGSVVMTLSKEMIDHAADFSYDPKDRAKAKVIPAGSISANELLEGNLLDAQGQKAASIENIYFRDDDATQVVVGFNKTLGMGGDIAAVDYNDLQVIKKKHNDVDLKMSAAQTAQFENFKKSVAN